MTRNIIIVVDTITINLDVELLVLEEDQQILDSVSLSSDSCLQHFNLKGELLNLVSEVLIQNL
jgi:hypothetical protein